MIAVDTSAWAAVIFDEPERAAYLAIIDANEKLLVSAATLVELNTVVIQKLGEAAAVDVVDLMEFAGAEIVPMDSDQAGHAVSAYIRYGRGRHEANLAYGDVIAYALAKSREVPLLFKMPGFRQTDVVAAIPA